MLRRILHRRIFYIFLVLFLAMRYSLEANGVLSFDLFSAWTAKQWNIKVGEQYVKDSDVDDTVVGTVLANVSFGEDEYQMHSEQWLQNALRLFEHSQALVSVDILSLLVNSESKKDVLFAHIKHAETTLARIDANAVFLEDMTATYIARSTACFAEKTSGDQLFFAWLNDNDQAATAEWLETSLAAAPCYITNRIKANAYAYMAQKVKTHYQILERRRSLLTDNADLLINNTAYLEGDILDQLMSLKQQLQSVNAVSYQQVEGLFNLNIFNDERDLSDAPQYDQVLFNATKMPRFGKSWLNSN